MLDINFVRAVRVELKENESGLWSKHPNGCSFMIPENVQPYNLDLKTIPVSGSRITVGWYNNQEVLNDKYMGFVPGVIGETSAISLKELYEQLQNL